LLSVTFNDARGRLPNGEHGRETAAWRFATRCYDCRAALDPDDYPVSDLVENHGDDTGKRERLA